jgi:hypothetical protein
MNFSITPRKDLPGNNAQGTIEKWNKANALPIEGFQGSVAIPRDSSMFKDVFSKDKNLATQANNKSLASLAFHALAENYYRTFAGLSLPVSHEAAIQLGKALPKNHPAYSKFPGQSTRP